VTRRAGSGTAAGEHLGSNNQSLAY